jgi:hypothetical protein
MKKRAIFCPFFYDYFEIGFLSLEAIPLDTIIRKPSSTLISASKVSSIGITKKYPEIFFGDTD